MKHSCFYRNIVKRFVPYGPRFVNSLLCAMILFVTQPNWALAQEAPNTQVPSPSTGTDSDDSRQDDRRQLLELKTLVEKAMSNDDMIHTLEPHVAADFSIVTFTSRQFDDFEVFVREWNISRTKFLQGGTFTVKIDPKPAIFSDTIAICRGDSTNTLKTDNGTQYEFSSPWTAVCRKENGKWMLVRAHSSIDPFSNPILNSNIRWYLWLVGILATVAGLILGSFVISRVARLRQSKSESP